MSVRVLVTGGAGFVGSHLSARLLEAGHQVVVLERPGADLSDLPRGARSLTEDLIGDPGRAATLLKELSPTAIIHLAALVRAQPEDEWIHQVVETNVTLGTYLAAGAAKAGVESFITAGTYWDSPRDPNAYEPVNLYAASKRAFSDILRYYQRRDGFTAVELKLFGNYGPGDRRPNLFSALRNAAGSAKPVALTEGRQEVDILHIDDLCDAFLCALDTSSSGKLTGFRSYEIGTGTTASVREIARWYEEGRGVSLNLAWGAKESPQHIERAADRSAAETDLGWRPKMSIEQGVRALGHSDAG